MESQVMCYAVCYTMQVVVALTHPNSCAIGWSCDSGFVAVGLVEVVTTKSFIHLESGFAQNPGLTRKSGSADTTSPVPQLMRNETESDSTQAVVG